MQVPRVSADRIWPDNPEALRAGQTFRLDSIGLTCPVHDIYADTPLA